jgi:hypothetical protein
MLQQKTRTIFLNVEHSCAASDLYAEGMRSTSDHHELCRKLLLEARFVKMRLMTRLSLCSETLCCDLGIFMIFRLDVSLAESL